MSHAELADHMVKRLLEELEGWMDLSSIQESKPFHPWKEEVFDDLVKHANRLLDSWRPEEARS